MPDNVRMQTNTMRVTPGARRRTMNPQGQRSRTYLLVAVALVVIVITVATFARPSASESLAVAQHHYLSDVNPVEMADNVFNGSDSTPPNHSPSSTRSLVQALSNEFNELNIEKWPSVAVANVGELVSLSQSRARLLQAFESSASDRRASILDQQSKLSNEINTVNVRILKELKLPTPINATAPVSTKPLS